MFISQNLWEWTVTEGPIIRAVKKRILINNNVRVFCLLEFLLKSANFAYLLLGTASCCHTSLCMIFALRFLVSSFICLRISLLTQCLWAYLDLEGKRLQLWSRKFHFFFILVTFTMALLKNSVSSYCIIFSCPHIFKYRSLFPLKAAYRLPSNLR
jgi:hypothetical protein